MGGVIGAEEGPAQRGPGAGAVWGGQVKGLLVTGTGT